MSATRAPIPYGEAPDEPLAEILHIEGDLSDEMTLSRPIRVEVWSESGEFVADAAEFNVHSFGPTREDAIANLRAGIAAQRQQFETLGDRLSPSMQRDAEVLGAAFQLRHA